MLKHLALAFSTELYTNFEGSGPLLTILICFSKPGTQHSMEQAYPK